VESRLCSFIGCNFFGGGLGYNTLLIFLCIQNVSRFLIKVCFYRVEHIEQDVHLPHPLTVDWT
jgi:hypothetical protein